MISEVVVITGEEEIIIRDEEEISPSENLPKDSYKVTRVVDGDTLKVLIGDKEETVRVIGINTPETVDPRNPVECFGREASDYAKSLLTGKSVSLVIDPTQDATDKYQRLLRYVTLPNGRDYGETMIRSGYAYEYTYQIPYERQSVYKETQDEAKASGTGLWSSETCDGSKKL